MVSQKIFQLKFCMFSKFSTPAELIYVQSGFMKHLLCKFLVPFCFSLHSSKFIVFLGTLFPDTHNLCYFIKRHSMMYMINFFFFFFFFYLMSWFLIFFFYLYFFIQASEFRSCIHVVCKTQAQITDKKMRI